MARGSFSRSRKPKKVIASHLKNSSIFLIFKGRYKANFLKAAIDGTALLSANDNVLIKLGIDPDIHLPKINLWIKQLVEHQKRIDLEDEQCRPANDKNLRDLEAKLSQKLETNPDYELPYKLDSWSELDVFVYLTRHPNQEFAQLFVEIFARNRITGMDLIEIKEGKKEAVSVDFPSNEVLMKFCQRHLFSIVDKERTD